MIAKLNKQIGTNIKNRRKASGLTQEEFGFMISLTRASIINLETGRSSTTFEKLLQMCFIFQCSPNDILPVDFKFTLPNGKDFRAIKLDAKSKKLQAQLAEVRKQQDAILNQNKLPTYPDNPTVGI